MNYLHGLSELSVVVPAAVIVGACLFKKILKISFTAALAGAVAPFLVPLRDLPVLASFADAPHGYLVAGAWAAILSGGLGWKLMRPFFLAAVASFGIIRLGYMAVLGAALLVASLLIVSPEQLVGVFPGWKGPAGLLLLAASCWSVSRALLRMFRATVLVAVWGGVSLVLATSIFLDKLPHHVSRADLNKVQGVIPREILDQTFSRLQALVNGGAEARRFLRVAEEQSPTETAINPIDRVDA